jgi:hypothetical protein
VIAGNDDTVASCGTTDRTRDKWEDNAAFIAAANPAAILALLDELENSHKAYELLFKENAELRKDAERYRWLTFDHPKHETRVALYAITSNIPIRGKGNTDAAIDSAAKGESHAD